MPSALSYQKPKPPPQTHCHKTSRTAIRTWDSWLHAALSAARRVSVRTARLSAAFTAGVVRACGLMGTQQALQGPTAEQRGSEEARFKNETRARAEYLTFISPIRFRTLHLQSQQKFVENRTVVSNNVAIYNVLL